MKKHHKITIGTIILILVSLYICNKATQYYIEKKIETSIHEKVNTEVHFSNWFEVRTGYDVTAYISSNPKIKLELPFTLDGHIEERYKEEKKIKTDSDYINNIYQENLNIYKDNNEFEKQLMKIFPEMVHYTGVGNKQEIFVMKTFKDENEKKKEYIKFYDYTKTVYKKYGINGLECNIYYLNSLNSNELNKIKNVKIGMSDEVRRSIESKIYFYGHLSDYNFNPHITKGSFKKY